MKCILKNTDYDCIQWKGNNFDEICKFCEGTKISFTLNYQDNNLTFHNNYNSVYYEQKIKLSDYIIKTNNIFFNILSEEDFNKMYRIIN